MGVMVLSHSRWTKWRVENLISMNTAAVENALKQAFYVALEKAAQELVDIMRKEIPTGNLPGKPEWRNALRNDIHVLNRTVSGSMMQMNVGPDLGQGGMQEFGDFVKAMLINYGSGSRATPPGAPIQTWPGKVSWDDNLDRLRVSPNVHSAYKLPRGFNQKGSKYYENSVRIMRSRYKQIMDSVLANFDFSIFVHSDVRARR